MKNLLTISLVFVAFLFCACNKEATVAKIEGEFILSDSVDVTDLVGMPVYLHKSMGNSPMGCVDSVFASEDLTFSFDDVAFGFYMIGIGSDLILEPERLVIELDEDHALEELTFTVSHKE